jgi:TonB family protein
VSPNETEKPKEEEPQVTTMPTQASTPSVAAEATAFPTLREAPEATHSIAPTPGTGESARREKATWQKELAAHFNKFKRYPAERKSPRAEVVVSFVLDRMGHVISKRIVKGSGDAAFDAAALDMLQRSDPVPAPPPLVADDGLTFSLPVIFQAKGKARPPPAPAAIPDSFCPRRYSVAPPGVQSFRSALISSNLASACSNLSLKSHIASMISRKVADVLALSACPNVKMLLLRKYPMIVGSEIT